MKIIHITLNLWCLHLCFSDISYLSFCLLSLSYDAPISLAHLFPLHNICRNCKRISWEECELLRYFLNRITLSLILCCLGLQNVPIALESRSISLWKGRLGLCLHNTLYCSLLYFEKNDFMNTSNWWIECTEQDRDVNLKIGPLKHSLVWEWVQQMMWSCKVEHYLVR